MVRETSESLFEERSRSLRLLAVGRGAAGRVCGLALREDWLEGCERNFGSAKPVVSFGLRLKVVLYNFNVRLNEN